MRPVDKGSAPKKYKKYGDARHDLAERLGYYCSYCEMKTMNMIEIEHEHPTNKGGSKLDWNNFLLSCKYCNTVKNDNNTDLTGYLWPDLDNTDLAFTYSEGDTIQPNSSTTPQVQNLAQKSIDLMGLDRFPGNVNNQPTEADTRWISRKEAWDLATKAYNDWLKAPIDPMAHNIARVSLNGHYSIWIEVFKDIPKVVAEIDKIYEKYGLYKKFDTNGDRVKRTGANI